MSLQAREFNIKTAFSKSKSNLGKRAKIEPSHLLHGDKKNGFLHRVLQLT